MKVAVEDSLSDVKEYLEENGIDVVDYDEETSINSCDAIVTTGLSDDIMDIETTSTNAVFIDADGMTPEEVYDEIIDMFED